MLTSAELKQYKYFSGLSEGALQELTEKLETVAVPMGSVIIEQGTPPDAFYFVKQGEVEVLKETLSGHIAKISVVSSGEAFGEIALLTCSHRCSSVHAISDVTLLRLSKKDFEDTIMMDSAFTSMMVKKIADYQMYNKMKLLQPFALLEPQKMLALADKLKVKSFKTSDNIINQGDEGDYYYIVKSGCVSVLVKKKHDNEAKQVAVLCAGEGFGEEALIREQKRNATVKALEETAVFMLDKKDFNDILRASYLDYAFPEDFEEMTEEQSKKTIFLDARIPAEYEEEHIEGAINLPLEILRQKYHEMDVEKEYFTYCTNDSRGMASAFLLKSHGFMAKNLRGGISGWTGAVSNAADGIHMPGR